jgi:3-hydroxybutyryl-CoA dehydrogenase
MENGRQYTKMIETIGIIGGGKMGTDIFHFLSGFPFRLIWIGKSRAVAENVKQNWIKKQQRALKFEQINETEYNETLNRVQFGSDLNILSGCDLIIECITEDNNLKMQLFRELDTIVQPTAVFASNTSSVPIRTLVPSNRRRERFIGLHFFYPVRLKNLVEVNALPETTDTALNRIREFLVTTGKYYKILQETDHFLFNRLFLPLQAGIYKLHEEEKIPVQTLDLLIKEILFPIGIFEFFDQVGIDVIHTSVTNYAKYYPNDDFYIPLINGLKRLKDQNHLGVKTGRGFYDYTGRDSVRNKTLQNSLNTQSRNIILKKMYGWYFKPVFETAANHVLTRNEADYIVKEYMGLDKSPFELAKEIGFNS